MVKRTLFNDSVYRVRLYEGRQYYLTIFRFERPHCLQTWLARDPRAPPLISPLQKNIIFSEKHSPIIFIAPTHHKHPNEKTIHIRNPYSLPRRRHSPHTGHRAESGTAFIKYEYHYRLYEVGNYEVNHNLGLHSPKLDFRFVFLYFIPHF